MTVIKPSDSFTGAQNIDVVLFIVVFLLLGKEYILQPILLLRIRCKPCIGFLAAISLVNCIDAATCCNMHLITLQAAISCILMDHTLLVQLLDTYKPSGV